MVGYRAWFYYAEKKADATLESMLDKDQYKESELVVLTIPLNNPYQVDQTGYVRVNGEINFGGRTYKLVKRKVTEGALVLLCMPDSHKMVLKKARAEFGNAASGITTTNKNSSRSENQKNFSSSDYLKLFANLDFGNLETGTLVHYSFHQVYISDPHITTPGKPPQSFC
jgi:hypothetical protein